MELEEELESDYLEGSSEDEVNEDLEEKKPNKRDHTHVNEESEHEAESDVDDLKKSKKMKFMSEKEVKKLSKPATAEELNRLRETENLFHSNLFRLQIDEMLKEVQMKKKHKAEFKKWLEKFQSGIMKLEDSGKKHSLSDFSWLKAKKMKIPLPTLPKAEKGIYQFRKPLSVEVIGSFALETMVGPRVNVDVVLHLPQKFYQNSDFVNCVYHLKRALYLCDIMNHIQNSDELVEDISFISDGIDVLKPRIEIVPSGKLSKHVTVLLTVIVEKTGIKLSKFNPDKSNVSKSWFFETGNDFSGELNAEVATPFYNSTILSDLTLMDNYKFILDLLKPFKNIRDGIVLLKVWLRQHELTNGNGDFNGLLVAALVSYLFQIRKLNSFMSSYQVVRTVFNYLVQADWSSNGITLCKNTDDKNIPTLTEFHGYHKVVFVDVTGYHNICYGMQPTTFQQIKCEAEMALKVLDDPTVNSFQILFMTSVPFYRHFDHLIVYHNKIALENIAEIHSSEEDRLNHCQTIYSQLINLFYDVLKRGLNVRVNEIRIRHPEKVRWKSRNKFKHVLNLTFGVNLNPEKYYLSVEKAGENEYEEFRDFWGKRSELRRFQDGTITEAIIWDAPTISSKRLICKQIVTYLMKYKFSLNPVDFMYVADEFEKFIGRNIEESAMKVIETCDNLSKQLRNLKNLPLDIVSVQGASPVFRFTEVTSMEPFTGTGVQINGSVKRKNNGHDKINVDKGTVPPFVNPVKVILHLGATNKWPQDVEAVNRLRTAFYLKIAQTISNQCELKAQAFTNRIEVFKDGYVFHLKIFCPNEVSLLKQVVEDGLLKYRDNQRSMAVEKEVVFMPKLTGALHGLYEQNSSFGPASCLVKRWINSQMMDSAHISEEVLDLLVASLYLTSAPHQVPQQPQVAFMRFLHLIARTDWNVEYIVLNINNELKKEDLTEIESYFSENRESLPPLFIVTPYDRTKSALTIDSPNSMILLRIVELCSNAIDFIEKRIYKSLILENEFDSLFDASLEPYNAIIHLNKNFIPRLKCEKERNSKEIPYWNIPVNGFDPAALFISELRESYGEVALFFYDKYGGTAIGVLWKPGMMEPKEFKVSNMAMREYNKNSKNLKISKGLIIEDFMIIGKGLVKSVDVRENGEVQTYTFL